ncbi:MAG: TonB family protein [Burkholderiales bacterium]|nr:TonB family protein [Burkholderiales bacterium]
MPSRIADDRMPRLLLAVGVSLALHAAVVLSVGRQPGSDDIMAAGADTTPPLIARLAAVVSESVAPVPASSETPAETIPETRLAAVPSPPATTGGQAGDGGGVYYFKSSELDRRPFPLTQIEVPAPESPAAQAGAVMLRLRISESGRIDDAKIVMSTGIAEFEEAALREFAGARFHPGYRANVPVRSEMLIEVTLRPPTGPAARGALPAAAGSEETGS